MKDMAPSHGGGSNRSEREARSVRDHREIDRTSSELPLPRVETPPLLQGAEERLLLPRRRCEGLAVTNPTPPESIPLFAAPMERKIPERVGQQRNASLFPLFPERPVRVDVVPNGHVVVILAVLPLLVPDRVDAGER